MPKQKEESETKKMIFELDKSTDEKFRDVVYKRKGLRKGAIKEALEEAIDLWMKQKGVD